MSQLNYLFDENEQMEFAKEVVRLIKEAGATRTLLNSSEEERINIIKFYAQLAVDKITAFVEIYKTNPEAKKAFVLEMARSMQLMFNK